MLTREVAAWPGGWRPGSLHAHVNPMGGGLGGLPTMPPIGFSCALTGERACSGVRARAAREVRRRCAHNADHLARDTALSAFVADVVCTLGATPTKATRGPLPNRGNCAVRGARLSLAYVEGAAKRGELHQ